MEADTKLDRVADEVVEPRRRPMGRNRAVVLVALALGCLGVVLVFGILVMEDRSPLGGLDLWGRSAEDWADNHPHLVTVLRAVEVGFATIGMIIWTLLVVLALATRRRYRAAAFAVAVMIATSLATTGIKLWLGRDRPQWQDPVHTLTSHSFPSGHASSSAALAGILVILSSTLVRDPRWLVGIRVLAVVIWVGVCLDRVLLGRHFPTDVIAGSFLGAAVVLLGVVLFDPARVRPQRRR